MPKEPWCEKHVAFARVTEGGVKWVCKTRDRVTGQPWLFRFAYDEKADAEEAAGNLDEGRQCDAELDRALNYVRDRPGRVLEVWRPTTRKFAWLIRPPENAGKNA